MAQNPIPEAAWPSIRDGVQSTKNQTPVVFESISVTDGTKDANGDLIITEQLQNLSVLQTTSDSLIVEVRTIREIKRENIVTFTSIRSPILR